MRANKNINLSCSQILKYLTGLLGTTSTRQIVNPHWHILQSLLESLVMLKGKNRCRYQYSHLLIIHSSLESSTNSHFRLTKAHITTNQTVHRSCTFHILFEFLCSLQLIGCVFIKE